MAGKRFIENIGTKDEGTVVVASRASVATDAKNRRLPPERKPPVLLVGGSRPQTPFSQNFILRLRTVPALFSPALGGYF